MNRLTDFVNSEYFTDILQSEVKKREETLKEQMINTQDREERERCANKILGVREFINILKSKAKEGEKNG